MKILSNVLKITPVTEPVGGVLIQFSLSLPDYCVKDGKLFSRRADKIEMLLDKRKQMFGLDCKIELSKSCLEGKKIWNRINNL